ncbi:MAG TPA: CHASE2 domain-containing protein [Casimicrobiaceae bacterium]
MTVPAAEGTALHTARIHVIGAILTVAIAAALAFGAARYLPLQSGWFDACQRMAPRAVESSPVTIVDIDDRSLATFGRWPWPRNLLAQLIHTIDGADPAAIGIDVVMPDPDPLSPDNLIARIDPDAALSNQLADLPSTDRELASALAASPTALIVVESPRPTTRPFRVAPVAVRDVDGNSASASAAIARLPRFPGVIANLPMLNAAAKGWGFASVSGNELRGTLRRIPLVANIDGTLVPALTVEMWRIALHVTSLRLVTGDGRVRGVRVGNRFFPAEADGAARIWFSPHLPERFVSAKDVLEGTVDPARFAHRFVLIGVTATAQGDYLYTPVGARMPGTEIHAQLLENLYGGTLLVRPTWGPVAEALVFLVLGTLVVWATPLWPVRYVSLLAPAFAVALLVAGFVAYRGERILLDAATPTLALFALSGLILAMTLATATRNRKALEAVVQRQREENARVEGELAAARRIQTEMLPEPSSVADPRLGLAAAMEPAQEVGGDLYDFYRLDDQRLFFMLGDVSGKGLSASIFMAVSKALCKSVTLRSLDTDVGDLLSAANLEIARDNTSSLFVTVFAGILDLTSGEVEYCNAGHENPFVVRSGTRVVERIEDGGGPPLCAVDGYAYRSALLRLGPGDVLCLVTDGVTEAQDSTGALYGAERVAQVLAGGDSAEDAVARLGTDVAAFTAGAVQSDDITMLALCWKGG